METPTAVNKIPFDKIIHLFIQKCERCQYSSILPPSVGGGYVHIFDLEKGLQTRFWNCYFNEALESYSDVSAETENKYFTLALFLNTEGLKFCSGGEFLQDKNIIWDTLFISAASPYKMFVAPNSNNRCLSISFSKKWLYNNVLKDSDTFKDLKENIDTTKAFSLLESMNASEKEVVQELFEASWKKSLGSFYIKCRVLKIIYDFLYKIKERETFINNPCIDILIAEAEKYLCHHITSSLPNLKDLAYRFSISEPTLKRQFKKRYGMNMSTYFIRKKMEYAQELINEKNLCVTEVARRLGYRNVNNFITMFHKHIEVLKLAV